ncbi:hypothetical protein [Mycetohabitans endofungorum]|uniref:hypothetical protein n=1 Tax=Mycetohabitans endofungorum TaxID=417203 RepID=UPI002B060320|nr:hypothetical protein [Mycetohabitans endofungorum]
MAKRRSTDAGFSGGVICLSQPVRSLATSELRDDAPSIVARSALLSTSLVEEFLEPSSSSMRRFTLVSVERLAKRG